MSALLNAFQVFDFIIAVKNVSARTIRDAAVGG